VFGDGGRDNNGAGVDIAHHSRPAKRDIEGDDGDGVDDPQRVGNSVGCAERESPPRETLYMATAGTENDGFHTSVPDNSCLERVRVGDHRIWRIPSCRCQICASNEVE